MRRVGMTGILLAILAGCGATPGSSEGALTLAARAREAVTSEGPDPVLAWNATAVQMIVGPGGASKPPPLGLVEAAMVQVAIYDAVNAIAGYPYMPYGPRPTVVSPAASAHAPAAAAAHDMLLALYPANASALDACTPPRGYRCRMARKEFTGSRSASRPRRPSSRSAPATGATLAGRSPHRAVMESGSRRLPGSCRRRLHGLGPSRPGR